MPKVGQKVIPLAGAGGCPGSSIPVSDSSDKKSESRDSLQGALQHGLFRPGGSVTEVSGPLPPKGTKPKSPPPTNKGFGFPALPKSMQPNADKAAIIEEARADLLLSQYDELNKLWEKAERELAKFRVPHDVEVTQPLRPYGHEDIEGHKGDCIAWRKLDNVWRICWGEHVQPVGDNAYWETRPVSDCPMEARVAAAKHLPALIEAVREARNNYIPKVADACEQIRNALKLIHVE